MDRCEKRIEAAFLVQCSSQAAYDWLFSRRHTGDQRPPRLFEAPDVLEYLLVRRKDPFIDLAIARFGHSPPMIRRVFRRGNTGTRCAALANLHVGPRTRNRINEGWLLEDELSKLIRSGSEAELEALIKNRFLNDEALECLLERKEEFADLSEEQYIKMLIWLGKNPRISSEYDRRVLDGWAEYKHGRVVSLAWELARHLATTQTNARVLYELLKNTALPFGYDNPEEVLERWRIEEEPKNGLSSLAYSYLLRTRLADVLKADNKLLSSNDPAARESFYRRFYPWQYKDWPKFIERDGELAFYAMAENDEFWRNAERREVLSDLAWKVPDPHSDMWAPNTYNAVEERKLKEHPEWFADEDSEYTNASDAIVRRIEKKMDKLVDAVEPFLGNDNYINTVAQDIVVKVERLSEHIEDAGNNSQNEIRYELHSLRDELLETRAITEPTPCRYIRAPMWTWIIIIGLLILILLK